MSGSPIFSGALKIFLLTCSLRRQSQIIVLLTKARLVASRTVRYFRYEQPDRKKLGNIFFMLEGPPGGNLLRGFCYAKNYPFAPWYHFFNRYRLLLSEPQ